MKKYYSWIFAFAIFVVIVIAAFLVLSTGNKQQNKTAQNTANQNANSKISTPPTYQKATVTLSASGFNPTTLTVKKGTIIIWTNKSGVDGSVNSDDYPTNLLYPKLNLGRFSDGSSMTVLLEKSGKYTYHNELNLNQKGIIIVQ